LWRVEVGIAGEESEQERARFAQRSDEAVRELQALPQVGTDAIRTDERAGATPG
jgi:hypothetical protein